MTTTPIFVRLSNDTFNESIIDSTDSYVITGSSPNPLDALTLDIASVSSADIDYISGAGSFSATLNTSWNSVKNIEVVDTLSSATVSVDNFVHANIFLGDGGNSIVDVENAKRGNIFTGDGDDEITVNALTNDTGWTNWFNIDAGLGDDTIKLTGDKDITEFNVSGDDGADMIVLNSGYSLSLIDAGDGDDTITAGTGADEVYGGDGDDFISGGAGKDEIYGDDGNDALYGGLGIDVINGNLGSDTILGNEGADILKGGKDGDFINGNTGDDFINGNKGNDTLYGGAGNDTIYGGKDNDIINGSAGRDTLVGGFGDDVFAFSNKTDSDTVSGFDYIQDFGKGNNQIDLSAIYAGGSFASDVVVSTSGFVTFVKATDGSGFEIGLEGIIALDASDFIF